MSMVIIDRGTIQRLLETRLESVNADVAVRHAGEEDANASVWCRPGAMRLRRLPRQRTDIEPEFADFEYEVHVYCSRAAMVASAFAISNALQRVASVFIGETIRDAPSSHQVDVLSVDDEGGGADVERGIYFGTLLVRGVCQRVTGATIEDFI